MGVIDAELVDREQWCGAGVLVSLDDLAVSVRIDGAMVFHIVEAAVFFPVYLVDVVGYRLLHARRVFAMVVALIARMILNCGV